MLGRPLLLLAPAFVAGILLSDVLPCRPGRDVLWVLIPLSLTLPAAVLTRGRPAWGLLAVSFCLMGLLLALLSMPVSHVLPRVLDGQERMLLEGVLLEPQETREGGIRLRIGLRTLLDQGQRIPLEENITLAIYRGEPDLRPGDRIRFEAKLRPLRDFNNPGRYDYVSSMARKGYFCSGSVPDSGCLTLLEQGDMPWPLLLVERLREGVRDFYRRGLAPEAYGLCKALVLGQTDGITQDMREAFDRTGLGHILAVSGLNIGLVAWLSFSGLRRLLSLSYSLMLRLDTRRLAALLTCIPVVGYTALAGFQVSCQRAMVMGLVFLFSIVIGRAGEIGTTVSLAALLVLAVHPQELFGISFQLSFLAVIGILVLYGPLTRWSGAGVSGGPKSALRRFGFQVLGLVAVSLAATLFLLPILVHYFHRLSLVTLAANLCVVPLVGFWVIPLGLLSILLLPISGLLAGYLLTACAWGIDLLMPVTRFWSDLSWAALWVPSPSPLEFALYYLLLLGILFFRKAGWIRVGVPMVLLAWTLDVTYWVWRVYGQEDLRITFFDVGKGNAALVEFPRGKKMLIDGGGIPRGTFDIGRMVVAPALWHEKIRRLDWVVLSHPDEDHMGGLPFLVEAFQPKAFWHMGACVESISFERLMKAVGSAGVKVSLPEEVFPGEEIEGVRVEVLHPLAGGMPRTGRSLSKINDRSLVLRISWGPWGVLFPGDLEKAGEAELVGTIGEGLESVVLLCPHHGSRSSCSTPFLDSVSPWLCVVSCGGASKNFPHPEVLGRLALRGTRVMRTDQAGAIQLRITPGAMEVWTWQDARGDFVFDLARGARG